MSATQIPASPPAPRLRWWQRLGDEIAVHQAGVAPEVQIALVICPILCILQHYDGDVNFYNAHLASFFSKVALHEVFAHVYWFLASFVAYFAIPLIVLRVTKMMPVSETGLGLGDWRIGLPIAASLYLFMLGCLLVVARWPEFGQGYPLNRAALASPAHFALYETSYMAYFVAWEFFFRGFLTIGLHRRIGNLAIFVSTIPFAILHMGKPQAEAMGSVIAGIALGMLAIRTRSIWWGFFLHGAVALTLDVLIFAGYGRSPGIVS